MPVVFVVDPKAPQDLATITQRYADFAERRVQLFDGRILFEDRVRSVVTHDLAPAV